MRMQLEQGVENQKLNACAIEDFFSRDQAEYFFDGGLRSFVTITNGILAKLASAIDQTIVCAPAIYPDGQDLAAKLPSPFARLA
jgi:hypothetical protein